MIVMSGTTQTTFGTIYVNEFNGNRQCDKCIYIDENGEPRRCKNSADVVIHRKSLGMSEFYCHAHAKDSWKDIEDKE